MKKKLTAALFLIALVLIPVHSMDMAISSQVDIAISGYPAIDLTETDSIPMRLTSSFQFDIDPVMFTFGRTSLALHYRLQFVSPSMIYAGERLSSFVGNGFGLSVAQQFTDRFRLGILVLAQFNDYINSESVFFSMSGTIRPEIILLETRLNRLSVSFPVDLQFRREYFVPQIGVGVSYCYDIYQNH